MALPNYYSALADFRALFEAGIPILNYHRVAPLPAQKSLKSLYMPPKAFAHQLRELQAAGFTSTALTTILTATNNACHHVVISFDDGYRNVAENAMAVLARYRFKAIQFLVPKYLGRCNEWDLPAGIHQAPLMDARQVREWLAAGHEIGAHSLTHPYLTRLPEAAAREEIAASKKQLEDTFGVAVEHFCYPYGDFNEKVRELVVAAGFRTACTVQFGVNTAARDPFALFRIRGRHPTRKLRTLLQRLGGRPGWRSQTPT